MSFWDSSAIVPLCAYQQTTRIAHGLSRRFPEKYVWTACVVEVSSAFARLQRDGLIDEKARLRCHTRLKRLEFEWNLVGDSDRIIELARTLPLLYGLKAMDSLQLAAALVWCKEFPNGKDFVSADQLLLSAAESAGFTIHNLA